MIAGPFIHGKQTDKNGLSCMDFNQIINIDWDCKINHNVYSEGEAYLMSTTFDTLEYVHKLKEAGVPENQAETHARALSEVIQSNLATKQGLEKTKTGLTIEIEKVKSDLTIEIGKIKIEIEKSKTELIKWNVGAVFTALGLFTAIIKLLG